MEIKRVVVDQEDILGQEVFVSAMEEVKPNDFNPVAYRIFECSSRKEPSFYLIVEGLKMSDIPNGRQKVVFPKGIAIERRTFRVGNRRKNELVIVAPEMRTVKG